MSAEAPSSQLKAWPPASPACAQCHAYNGASDGSGAFPRIAGQSAYYLAKELRDYASGVRANAVMAPIAKALSSDDIADVAAYYASVNAPYLPLASPDPALIKRGEQLAKVGDAAKELQSCNNCHGPGGAGEPPAIPYLAGQYAHYIAFQLTDVAARIPQEQSRRNGGRRQAPRRTRYRGSRCLLPAGRRLRSGGDAANEVIAMAPDEPQHATAHSASTAGAPVGAEEAAQALRDGPIGAFIVASIAVGLLFLGWLAFYFLLFMPRGSIG